LTHHKFFHLQAKISHSLRRRLKCGLAQKTGISAPDTQISPAGNGSAEQYPKLMKSLMILGALVGFLIGIGCGLAGQASWPAALWRGCAVALVAAILARWWGRIWLEGLQDAIAQRRNFRKPTSAAPKPTAKA